MDARYAAYIEWALAVSVKLHVALKLRALKCNIAAFSDMELSKVNAHLIYHMLILTTWAPNYLYYRN